MAQAADKHSPFTSNLQPSTIFDTARSPTTHSSTGQLTSVTSPTRPPSTSINSILSDNMESKPQFNIMSTLMSPPDIPYDSFGPSAATPQKQLFSKPSGGFPLSPPVSPFTKNDIPDEQRSINNKDRDPILYPSQDTQNGSSQPPLFDEPEIVAAKNVVDGHLAARASEMFRAASPPRRGEYELALEFKSRVAKAYNANRQLWFRRERQFLMEDKAIQSGAAKRYHAIAPHPSRPRPFNGVSNRPTTKGVKNAGIGPKPTRRPPVVKLTKPDRATTPGEAKTARTDKNFNSIPDYSPPVSSLPNKHNSLKVDWRGAPIDLSDDPYYHLLHEDERLLAANLRLDCATYLTSKRRIFERRRECIEIGKEFRKTDAQQACKIDVNKASKLWQAFDKVGWLDPSWMKKHM